MVRKNRRKHKKGPQVANSQPPGVEEGSTVADDTEGAPSSRSVAEVGETGDSVDLGPTASGNTAPPTSTAAPESADPGDARREGAEEVGQGVVGEEGQPPAGLEHQDDRSTADGEGASEMTATAGLDNGPLVSMSRLAELQEDYDTMLNERDSLRVLMEVKDAAVKQAEADKLIANQRYKASFDELQAVKVENSNMSKQLACSNEEISNLKLSLKSMEKELADFRAQNSELALSLSKMNEERGDIEKQAESLKQSSSASESTIQDLTEKLRVVQSERDAVKIQLAETQADMWRVEAEGKHARAEADALRDGPQAQLEDLQVEIQDLTNQLCSTEFLLEDCKVKKSRMEDTMARMQHTKYESMFLSGLGGAAVSLGVIGGLCLLLSRKKS